MLKVENPLEIALLKNYLTHQVLMVSASGVSKTIFLSSGPDELCNRSKLLLQEREVGKNSNMISQEIFALVDKLLEYKCTSKEEHEQFLIK